MFVFCISCKGQNKTELPKNDIKSKTKESKPGPEVIGSPPPLVPDPDPVNELAVALANAHPGLLVSQIIGSIFQDSKGNFWFGPAGQSVARYDREGNQPRAERGLQGPPRRDRTASEAPRPGFPAHWT